MLQAIWQEHRPFILRVAAGLAVFLVLMNVAVGFRVEGRRTTERAIDAHAQVDRDLKRLDGKHRQEQRNAGVWEERVDGLRERLGITDALRVEPPQDLAATMIDFPRRFGEIHASFADRAKRSTIGYPEQNDIDFRESKSLDERQWFDRYVQLEIVRRILDAGIEAKIDRFVTIQPEALVVEAISDDPEFSHYRYPVTVELVASYAAALAFLQSFQREGAFLSIELGEIAPESLRGEEGPSPLRVRLTAVGIDLGPAREDGARNRKPRGFGR
jgi:hypothetical protein